MHAPASSSHLRRISDLWGVSESDIRAAADRVRPHVHLTPVLTSRYLSAWLNDAQADARFFFKAENLQRTGSFKVRGAVNAVAQLSASASDPRPLVTHSAGNHGQAVALAAGLFGRAAHVVVPATAPRAKRAGLRAYGALVEECAPDMAARVERARALAARVRGVLLHPFEDAAVVAGQGTVAVDILQQVPHVDAIVASIGGGGLISGIALMALSVNPRIKIVGAEPANCASAAHSLAAGQRVQTPYDSPTVADGVKASIGPRAWPVVQHLLAAVVSVPEHDIKRAMLMTLTATKTVVEGAAATAVAATRTQQFRRLGCKNVVVVLCGGNVDLSHPPWLS